MRRRMSADGMSVVEDSLMVDEEARRGVEEEEEEELFEVWREVRCPQDPSFGNFELSPV